jgi:malonate-semialdehyde dehydrogenase (acetylating)/methylmalonate-semialdehyde dehydrogenase
MVREPLGVVAGVSPFNFPLMIPLWMAPLAIGCGNAFILKPSEQTPMSAVELARLFDRAGLPPGIFSVVHGDREIVEAICDAPGIAAVGFVGSTPVAREVHRRSAAAGKRVRALGGAKNHLVVMPDADPETAVENVVASATGCAGQRCMAAGVMVAVGDCEPIVSRVRARMATLEPGVDFGPVISAAALDRIAGYNERAGAAVTVDGRMKSGPEGGHYIGASVIETNDPTHEAAWREIFGPTLTVIRCATLEEAIEIENAEPHGNAASIYTRSGEAARRFAQAAASGMIGVNVGVPVPREPFPFGGWGASAFGDGDLTGPAAIDFWTRAKKITAKWVAI